jgi:hypothetical protein
MDEPEQKKRKRNYYRKGGSFKSADWAPRFFEALLACTGVIHHACIKAGIARKTIYDRRDRDPVFARELQDTIESCTDVLEKEAVRRALGTKRLPGSDDLLKFLLRVRRYPNTLRLTGAEGQPLFDLEAQRRALANPDALRHVAAINAFLSRTDQPGGAGALPQQGEVVDGTPSGAYGLGPDAGGGGCVPPHGPPDACSPRQE